MVVKTHAPPTAEGRTWTVPYHTLMNELRENDKRKFKNYTRLSPEIFYELLSRLTPHLQTPTSGHPLQGGHSR